MRLTFQSHSLLYQDLFNGLVHIFYRKYGLTSLLFLSCLLPELLLAQISPTTSSILQHYVAQGSMSVYARQQQLLAGESLYSPWLRELEFRTETDEWNLERQEYSLRLNLSSRGDSGALTGWIYPERGRVKSRSFIRWVPSFRSVPIH